MSIDNTTPEFPGTRPDSPRAIADLSRPKNHSSGPRPRGKRGAHRSQFPTPGFYLFAFLLNLSAGVLISLLLMGHSTNIPLLSLGITGIVGLIVSIYSVTLRPRESNRKFRKVLVLVTVILGFVILVALGATILMTPNLFV